MIMILVYYDSMQGLMQRMLQAVTQSATKVLNSMVGMYNVFKTKSGEALVAAAGKTDHTAPEMSL
jgi:hypothetical protein